MTSEGKVRIPLAVYLETGIPEAKTQSSEIQDFSEPGLKDVESGRLQKSAEAAIERASIFGGEIKEDSADVNENDQKYLMKRSLRDRRHASKRTYHQALDITMLPPKQSVLALTTIFLALAVQIPAHAIPKRVYLLYACVKGTPKRSDVPCPSIAKPCVEAGSDDSTSVSVQVDETGTGKKPVAGKVTKNGNPKTSKVETDQVVFSLPLGTKCVGRKSKNLEFALKRNQSKEN
ncbi:hypothetical protein B0H14DRAFT_3125044 [Mycena olivaceomarginata]|nr:hypothetical protein B0H14DRAFT_3125044 [Mycena olivaceomarginata]